MREKKSLLHRMLERGILHAKKGGSSAPPAPDYAAAAQAQGAANKEAAIATAGLNSPDQVTPYGSLKWSMKPGADPNNPKPGDWISTSSLSPEQQQLYQSNVQTQQGLAALGNKAIGSVSPTIGTDLDTSQLPSAVTTNLPTSADQFAPMADQARQSYYDKATRLYGEQFGQQEDAMRTQLANQGLQQGTQAYDRAVDQFQRNKDLAYQNAADTATQKGYDLQTQELNNLINAVGAQNASRSSGIQQQTAIRETPINEIIGLMSGTQVQNPQFSNQGSGAQVQSAPLYNAFSDYSNANINANNANAAGKNAMMGGLAGLGSAAMFAFSDLRLKKDVEVVGSDTTLKGNRLPVYRFRYLKEPRWVKSHEGIMAQDVLKVEPEAVMTDEEGYYLVNYKALFGEGAYRYA
jgi:hypothetical protein